MKWLGLSGLVLAIVGSASWHLLQDHRSGEPKVLGEKAIRVYQYVQGIGHVEPASEMRKLMFRTGGVIRLCRVKAGEKVRKGDLLVELDNSTQRADGELARKQLEQTRAEAVHVNAGINPYRIKVVEQTVERMREKLRHQTREVERSRPLLANRSISEQEHEAMETLWRQAEVELREREAELVHLRKYVTPENKTFQEAKVRQAEANLGLLEERLAETRLSAPFDGTVLKVVRREGEAVSTFIPETVVLFGDLSRVRVRAEMDERFVKYLAEGQPALIFGRNMGGKTYQGRIVELDQVMGDKTVFTRSSSERKDLTVLQVLIEMEVEFHAPAGLQVDVKVDCRGKQSDE